MPAGRATQLHPHRLSPCPLVCQQLWPWWTQRRINCLEAPDTNFYQRSGWGGDITRPRCNAGRTALLLSVAGPTRRWVWTPQGPARLAQAARATQGGRLASDSWNRQPRGGGEPACPCTAPSLHLPSRSLTACPSFPTPLQLPPLALLPSLPSSLNCLSPDSPLPYLTLPPLPAHKRHPHVRCSPPPALPALCNTAQSPTSPRLDSPHKRLSPRALQTRYISPPPLTACSPIARSPT